MPFGPALAALRLAKARTSLDAARACLAESAWDDAVNRAAHAALLAARAALAMRGDGAETAAAIAQALDSRALEGVPADVGPLLVELCEDGQVADSADATAFDESEAVGAVDLAERMVATFARLVPLPGV